MLERWPAQVPHPVLNNLPVLLDSLKKKTSSVFISYYSKEHMNKNILFYKIKKLAFYKLSCFR